MIRYETYYETFTKIFPIPSNETSVHYLPGNNDVGLNTDPIESQHARRRFTKHFGPLDQTVVIRNHTLVLLDASRIIEGSYRRSRETRNTEVPDDESMGFEKSVQPGLLQVSGSLQDDLEGSYIVLLSVQVTRHTRLFCLPISLSSDLTVLDVALFVSQGPFDGELAPITRVPLARMLLRPS